MIYKDGNVVAQIPTETQETGTATISRGFQFDPNSKYEVEVVLNYGSGVEIRGDKKEIPVAQLRVVTDELVLREADEMKFSDGSKGSYGAKQYQISIQSQSLLASCETLTGRIVTLPTATATAGQPVSTPQNTGDAYAAEYTLVFNHPLLPLGNKLCNVKIVDSLDNGARKEKFILSNRSRTALDVGLPYSNIYNTAVLYGGIGNKFWVEVGGVGIEKPIEPVGIVILGIDGLRQDVLYKPEEQQVNPPGQTSPYYVDPAQLNGLCEVLGGKKDLLLPCNPTGWDNKHIKFQNVTTIFPSITFASWASIFSGKLPNETGITGNEFFARDIFADATDATPGLYMLPKGMVTLDADGGAFRPLVQIGILSSKEATKSLPFILNHIMPAEFGSFGYQTPTSKKAVSTPNSVLQTAPLWAEINNPMSKRFHVSTNGGDKCGSSQYECRTVSMFNQYSRGASRHIYSDGVDWWGTPASFSTELKAIFTSLSVPDILDTAAVMDKSAAAESIGFINGYFAQNNQDGKRKRFPGVFSIYLSGLDHEAHVHGLGGYKNYFIETVDSQIKDIVKALKDKDEFDNKIFIIVADHGETQMPMDLTYVQNLPMTDMDTGEPYEAQFIRQAEMSCTLKTNFAVDPDNEFIGKNAQEAEKNNNNLHIWELGEVMKGLPAGAVTSEGKIIYHKILAPTEIVAANKGESTTNDPNSASVIAALNGPMAHIYVKGTNDWNSDPDNDLIIKVADLLQASLAEGDGPIPRLTSAVAAILIRLTQNSDYVVYNGATIDETGQITMNSPISLSAYFSGNIGYIEALKRITNMNHPNRSGDIILIMKDATTGAVADRYTTAYACKSWHGSLNPSDSYVPFIVSYPGGNKNELDPLIQKVCTGNLCEGNWKVKELISEIIKTQYSGQ